LKKVLSGLLIVLVVGLGGLIGFAQTYYPTVPDWVKWKCSPEGTVSDDTDIYWNIETCWVCLHVHGNIDLGSAQEQDKVLEATGNKVGMCTNCAGGVDLVVEPTAVLDPYDTTGTTFDGNLPNGASVFDHFMWKASGSTTNFTVASGAGSYQGFSALNDEKNVGSTGGPAHFAGVEIDYKYTTDSNDVPGNYSVTLLYTATAK